MASAGSDEATAGATPVSQAYPTGPGAFDTRLLDLVRRENDYALCQGASPLLTPAGHEVAHPDPRLLQHMIRELSFADPARGGGLAMSSVLFAIQKDLVEGGQDPMPGALCQVLERDPVVQRKTRGRAAVGAPSEALLDFLAEQPQALTFLFAGMATIAASVDELLQEHGQAGTDGTASFAELVGDLYRGLSPEKKAAVVLLCGMHEAGLALPLLLVLGKLTPAEYANFLFGIHLPGAVAASTHACLELLGLHWLGRPLLPDWANPGQSYDRLHDQALKTVEYLSYFAAAAARPALGVADLIRVGESYNLEFKTSLRWNVAAARRDQAMEHASLKSVAAFLNSGGGTLLIGVRDDGTVAGFDQEGFPTPDHFSLHFWNLVKAWLGQDTTACVRTAFEPVAGQTVFVVRCQPSPRPVFLNAKGGGDEFYIRIGPSSERLGIRDALRYIANRFPGGGAAAPQSVP